MTSQPLRLTDAPLLCELLDRPVPVLVSTVSPQGRPQASVVWAERRGDEIVMMFASSSAKIRNLSENPHISIVAMNPDPPREPGMHTYAQLTGRAEIRPGDRRLADRLAIAYGQPDGYAGPLPEVDAVHVLVERVSGLGPLADGHMSGWAPPAD